MQSIVILAIFSFYFFVGNRYEHRLYNIVEYSEENNYQVVSNKNWNESKKYNFAGFLVTVVILFILYLMVFQKGLF